MHQSITPCLRVAAVLALFGMFAVRAADNSPTPTARNEPGQPNEQFAPYEYLIGEWDVKAGDDGPVAAIIRVKWGPNRAYLWYSSSLLFDGREEPHLEGMLVWNAVHKNLDMLFSMDLRTGKVQEQGTMSVEPDGTVVRNITAVYGQGARAIGMPPSRNPAPRREAREHNRRTRLNRR